jgi:Bifunctional DNA primase/polymerase, N-terminal/AAA domain
MTTTNNNGAAAVAPANDASVANHSPQGYANFYERAIPLLERGVRVLPVDPGQKKCTMPGWNKLATTDPAVLKLWAKQNVNYNTGAMAHNDSVCILDCDAKGVIEAAANVSGQDVPSTFTVLSGGKGLPHYYFAHTDKSRALGNRSEPARFDFKAHKSYVVGPGSVLANGGEYKIVNDVPIVPMPNWLCDWIAARTKAEKSGEGGVATVPDFDIDAFLTHYGLDYDTDGDLYITNVCPVAGHKHQQSTRTGFLYDGESFGFKCFAEGCAGSKMTVGQVIKFLNDQPEFKGHGTITGKGPYAGPIWPKPESKTVSFELPATEGGDYDFVLNPLQASDDGWFPRGDVNLIAGPSGCGKTTVMLDLLEKELKGEPVFGHATNQLPYLILMQDRGRRGLRRTMKRMRIDPTNLPYKMLGNGDKVEEIRKAIEETKPMPAVVFIEGIDLLEGDSGKGKEVEVLLSRLYAVADHYHVAIIGSTGCPKMKPKDKYTSLRDTVIGSSVWGRKVETIITLQKEDGKESDDITIMSVMPRNAKFEEFRLLFEQGRLVLAPVVIEAVELTPMERARDFLLAVACSGEEFTRVKFQQVTELGRSVACDLLALMVADGMLVKGGKAPAVSYAWVKGQEPEAYIAVVTKTKPVAAAKACGW